MSAAGLYRALGLDGGGGPSLKEMLSSSGISDGFVVVMGIGVRNLTGQSGLGSGALAW